MEIKEEEEEGREVDELSDSRTVIGAPIETSDSANVAEFGSSLDNDSGSVVVDESSEVGNSILEVQAETSLAFAMAKSSFKLEHPLERRQAEAARIREKYPDRIPVIVERAEKSDVPDIDKKK
ncbi:unnamed protein product [Linum tenue]|nr:unnamed protein product [Linum tenue]